MSQSKVVRSVALLLVLVAGLLFAPSARADSQVRIVRLSLVDGQVQIDRGTGQGFEKAIMNMPITQGMRISTDNEASAEVEFEGGTTLRMAPRSDVTFAELGLRSSGARSTTVEVGQGTVYFNVQHKGDDEFRVAFANREIVLDRNVHFRLDLTGGNPEIAVAKGELRLDGPQERVTVKKNETLTLDLADNGRYDLAKGITQESYDSWNDERTDYATQYAASSYNTNSPYYYGSSDMNYYGSWSNWPGYGTMWRPFGVGYGWDPFYNGAWAWYPGFGYTWVSTYPWGWTPYRYGSWFFVPNVGWCWRPGGFNNWYTVPPVYNPPLNYHVPKPPPAVTVVGGTGIAPHPTVIVNDGVSLYREPKPAPSRETFSGGNNVVTPGVSTGPAPATTITPLRNTVVSPVTPTPNRDPRPALQDQKQPLGPRGDGVGPPSRVNRGAPQTAPRADRVAPPAPGGDRSAPPPPRVERSAPPAPRMAPPPPRIERSAPPAPRMAPPSGGGHSQGKTTK